jgi:8-oxo-dGTP diphosphatase
VTRIPVVGALISDGQGRILLAKRPEHKSNGGVWEFPGGKIENGESAEEALVRELREELQLEVRIVSDLGDYPFDYQVNRISLRVFVVHPLNAPTLTPDVEAVSWFAEDDLESINFSRADVEPYRTYLRRRVSGP